MPRPRATAAARGYGHHHRTATARLLAHLARYPGQPCPFCGKPMFVEAHLNPDGRKPHGDHGVPQALGGTQTSRLAHASCNTSEGAKLGNRLRRRRREVEALGRGRASRVW